MTQATDYTANARVPNRQSMLSEWLNYMGSIHVSAIDMGLSRVLPVCQVLGIDKGRAHVFMVAGTNGKGSTTATIASICQAAGKKTALYQSPHLVSFNERIRIDGEAARDELLIDAFVQIETARVACGLSLSFFEMTTLAALYVFMQADCDVWVLEVGLGGRLDVVNVIDADVCVITNVAIDHTDWLGDTRDAIGYEKAGILRTGVPVIYGETDMPKSVQTAVEMLGAVCHQRGVHYDYHKIDDGTWLYSSAGATLSLPVPSLSLDNVSTAVSAILASRLDISVAAIAKGLSTLHLAGRFDRRTLAGQAWLFDVAHNAAGVAFLLRAFMPIWQAHQAAYPKARLQLIFSMLMDKDIAQVTALLAEHLPVVVWHVATIDNVRAASIDVLTEHIKAAYQGSVPAICEHACVAAAAHHVRDKATADDFVLVLGSFHTISESMVALGLQAAIDKA